MSAVVLSFQKRKLRKPQAQDLVRKVRKMLRDGKMIMSHPSLKDAMLSKGITPMQMLTTIEDGSAIGNPVLDQHGDWRISLSRLAAGRKTHVTVALKADHFVVVKIT
jgi:hypothetical protein